MFNTESLLISECDYDNSDAVIETSEARFNDCEESALTKGENHNFCGGVSLYTGRPCLRYRASDVYIKK